MFIGRFERYSMRRGFNTDDVLIVMSRWKWGVAFGVMSLIVLGVSLVAAAGWSGRTLSGVGCWPWCALGLGLGALALGFGCFTHRWTISHHAITYASTFPRATRTARLSDLSNLVVHFAPASDGSAAGGATLPYSVRLRTKEGDEHLLGTFQFAEREAFDEFLINLHAILPLPLDDPEVLFPVVEEPSVEVLV